MKVFNKILPLIGLALLLATVHCGGGGSNSSQGSEGQNGEQQQNQAGEEEDQPNEQGTRLSDALVRSIIREGYLMHESLGDPVMERDPVRDFRKYTYNCLEGSFIITVSNDRSHSSHNECKLNAFRDDSCFDTIIRSGSSEAEYQSLSDTTLKQHLYTANLCDGRRITLDGQDYQVGFDILWTQVFDEDTGRYHLTLEGTECIDGHKYNIADYEDDIEKIINGEYDSLSELECAE